MAKVIGPCFGLDARGTLGKSIVFSIKRGVNYTRQVTRPKDKKSDSQLQNRAAFMDGVSKWRFATDLITIYAKENWCYYAAGTSESGYNRFMRYYLKANYDSTTKEKITPQVIPEPQ
ncbi:hypothetical protein KKG81_13425 [bacterium]|nr:hypothetical protein [bacterium]